MASHQSFSKRFGFVPVSNAIQMDSMDKALRTSLWNVFEHLIWQPSSGRWSLAENPHIEVLCRKLWLSLFKEPVDEIPYFHGDAHDLIKEWYFEAPWYAVYDFIEFIAEALDQGIAGIFMTSCNAMLEREMSGYRFVAGHLAPIVDAEELKAIDEAACNEFEPIRAHIQRATQFLSDRTEPDYRNSVKESISAVEAACRFVAGDGSAGLPRALEIINKKHPMHSAFREALKKLYGYTSDKDGIRHAIMEDQAVDFAEAKFMLVACAAFCNFLLQRSK